ncbi:MAG TPA: hypothetical protein VJK29_11640 [Terriglobales bacterium]|nr:hypothetical protein [Terriglobales bacterium]
MNRTLRPFWLVLAAATAVVALAPAARAQAPCCSITAIDARAATVRAKVNATSQTFEFRVADARVRASLRVGQAVYANFAAKQVSLDGRSVAGTILSGPGPAAASRGPVNVPAQPQKAQPTPLQTPAAQLGRQAPTTQFVLPTISAGAPQPAPRATVQQVGRWSSRSGVGAGAGLGRAGGNEIIHLRGVDGIERAQRIPEGARNLLLMHVRTLPPGESNHYIVNRQLAEEWIKAHPVPPSVKPSDTGGGHTGCNSFSWHCAQEAGQHAVDEASRQAEELRKKATGEWNHVGHELTHDWNMAEGCFADHPLHLADVPVQFSLPNEIPLPFKEVGQTKVGVGGGTGSASGKVRGTVTIGIPVASDFKAKVDLFYIPCLPFAIRPRSISADGTMTVGATLKASVTAPGQFTELFKFPPTGALRIPVYVIPIVIDGVPVAELDVSLFLEGTVKVDGDGQVDAHFKLNAPHKTAFNFDCSGKGCSGQGHTVPVPTTTSEDVQVKGRVRVKPAIYTALQLDFDIDALSARAGPQPFLLGEVAGCEYGAAQQSTAAPTTTQEFHALAGDLDWGVDLRGEAFIAEKEVGKPLSTPLVKDQHLWFQDLVQSGSTALTPSVEGMGQASAGKPAGYKLKMHPCYLYTDAVEYQIAWTGGAAPAPVQGCTWQAGQGTCWADPKKDTAIYLVWPSGGQYTITVAVAHDKHKRVFKEPPTQVSINVQAGGAPAGQ